MSIASNTEKLNTILTTVNNLPSGGTSDHSALSNLAYANSGHTGFAPTSHGNHVPTTQTASNSTFLRNDNTWATVTPANIGAAASSHSHSVATTSADGFMSYSDKTKLNGIATGATANTGTVTSVAVKMNSTTKGTVTTSGTIDLGTVLTSESNGFGNVVVGSTTIAADSACDTLTLVAGSNITLTPDATNDKVTIAASGSSYTLPTASSTTLGGIKVGSNLSISSGVLSATNTTYSAATSSTLGLVKIGTNITNSSGTISVATASSSTAGVVKVGSNLTISNGVLSGNYSVATTSANGLCPMNEYISDSELTALGNLLGI